MGIKNPNEVEDLAILEALHIYSTSYLYGLIVESDSANAISWVKYFRGPWKMQFLLNKSHHLVSLSQVSFQYIDRSVNGMAD